MDHGSAHQEGILHANAVHGRPGHVRSDRNDRPTLVHASIVLRCGGLFRIAKGKFIGWAGT